MIPSKPSKTAPERFVPGEMQGEMLEAEHLARYQLAQHFAGGRRVLDAGCGTGYGTRMLADAGAESATGIDLSEAALGAAGGLVGDGVALDQGDLQALPYDPASFDLVVCFEAIEHVTDPELCLDEIKRVMSGTGILAISSPNRQQYPEGNPHHQHEYIPEELLATLKGRFAHVILLRQQAWTASLILDDAAFATDGNQPIDLQLTKVVSRKPGDETFTIALASDIPLPEAEAVGVITAAEEVKRWLALFEDQHAVLTDQARVLAWHKEEDEERAALHRRLVEVEHELQRIPVLEREAYDARRDRLNTEARLEAAMQRITRADGVHRDMQRSVSWRITAPLRALKR